jgi:hypothetical protein
MKQITKYSLSIILILFLPSCGGGGGTDTKVETTQPSLIDFDVVTKATNIESVKDTYGGNTIAYTFTIKNYPDVKYVHAKLYVDDSFINEDHLMWFSDPSILNPRFTDPNNADELNLNKFQFLTKTPAKTLRVKLYENSSFSIIRNESDLIGDKTIDISNVVLEPDINQEPVLEDSYSYALTVKIIAMEDSKGGDYSQEFKYSIEINDHPTDVLLIATFSFNEDYEKPRLLFYDGDKSDILSGINDPEVRKRETFIFDSFWQIKTIRCRVYIHNGDINDAYRGDLISDKTIDISGLLPDADTIIIPTPTEPPFSNVINNFYLNRIQPKLE